MPRPLVLIPSSKQKDDGGRGRPYADAAPLRVGPLAESRRTILEALETAARELDDRGIARLCGVKPDDVASHRARLAALASAPTMPAHRRYTGVVHRFADLGSVAPRRVGVDVAIFGGLLGVAMLDDPVPDYRIEVTGRVPALGVLGTWWRAQLGGPLRAMAGSRRVWDLLPGEFTRLWPPAERGDADVVTVRFERPDGRAAPAASAKVAKGGMLRLLLVDPELDPHALVRTQPLEGWRFWRQGGTLTAVSRA